MMVVEPTTEFCCDDKVSFKDSFVTITSEEHPSIPISNPIGSSVKLMEGTCVGHAVEATMVVVDQKKQNTVKMLAQLTYPSSKPSCLHMIQCVRGNSLP